MTSRAGARLAAAPSWHDWQRSRYSTAGSCAAAGWAAATTPRTRNKDAAAGMAPPEEADGASYAVSEVLMGNRCGSRIGCGRDRAQRGLIRGGRPAGRPRGAGLRLPSAAAVAKARERQPDKSGREI